MIKIFVAFLVIGASLYSSGEIAASEKPTRGADAGPELVTSLKRVKGLWYACKMYMKDHGTFPPDLEVLFPDYINSTDALFCPFASTTSPTTYKYHFGDKDSKADDVLIESPQLTSYGGRVIVRRNGVNEILLQK